MACLTRIEDVRTVWVDNHCSDQVLLKILMLACVGQASRLYIQVLDGSSYWYTKEYAPAIVMGGFFIEPIAETTMLSPCLMFDSTQTVNLTATALPLK